MNVLKRILVGIALLTVLGIGWRVFFPGAEAKIRRQLTRMADAVSYEADASPLSGLAAASRFVEFFDADVAVAIRIPGVGQRSFRGRENLREAFLASRAPRRGLAVDFLDPQIRLSGEGEAIVEVTAKVTQPGNPDIQAQALRVRFVEGERGWVVSTVETIETLGR